MYFETTMHQSRTVADAIAAATAIKAGDVHDYEALIWTAHGRRLAVVADNHCNRPWLEVAVIDLDRNAQLESITAGWCETAEKLAEYLVQCETTDSVFRRKVTLPLDGNGGDTLAWFECGCCGTDFESTYETQQIFDQDDGYGICGRCAHLYR